MQRTKSTLRIQYCAFLLALFLLCSCSQTDTWTGSLVPDDAIDVTVSFDVPGMGAALTRMTDADEKTINVIHVLVFKGGKYQYTTKALDNGAGSYTIKLPRDVELTLVALANAEQIMLTAYPDGMIPEDEPMADVYSALVLDQSAAWPTTGDARYLPMWSEKTVTVQQGTALTGDNAIKLVRMHAAIDVISTADDFTMTNVYIYRGSRYGRLVPDTQTSGIWDAANGVALLPTEPAGGYGAGNFEYPVTENENVCTNKIYIPETPAGTDDYYTTANPCLVIEGEVNGTTYFYRVDIGNTAADGTIDYLPLLRNHQYTITIESVVGEGYATADLAASAPKGIKAKITSWPLGEVEQVIYQNGYMLGVSATNITLPSQAVTAQDGVTLTIVHNASPTIVWDGSNAISYTSSAGGQKTIYTFTAGSNSNSSSSRTGTMTITVGGIQHVVTITQQGATPQIRVYTKDGTQIAYSGEYAIKYAPYNQAEILDGFRVEWTPADLALTAKYADAGGDYLATRMASLTDTGVNEISTSQKTFSGGTKNFRLKLQGVGALEPSTTATDYDGRKDMAATVTLSVGDTQHSFRLRAWTPYAAWVDYAGETFFADNMPTDVTKPLKLIHNVPVQGKRTINAAAARPATTTSYIETVSYTPDVEGVMTVSDATLNTPTVDTYHNFAGLKETYTITTDEINKTPRGKNSIVITAETKDDCGGGKYRVAYEAAKSQLVYAGLIGSRCWSADYVAIGQTLSEYMTKPSCPPGMRLPYASEVSVIASSALMGTVTANAYGHCPVHGTRVATGSEQGVLCTSDIRNTWLEIRGPGYTGNPSYIAFFDTSDGTRLYRPFNHVPSPQWANGCNYEMMTRDFIIYDVPGEIRTTYVANEFEGYVPVCVSRTAPTHTASLEVALPVRCLSTKTY